MYEAVQSCTNCGAKLTLDDLRKPNCPYCATVYPHHSQAAQHAAMAGQVMNQMMAQQAQMQDAWRGGFGVGPPGAPPGFPPAPGTPGSPYADPRQIAANTMLQVNRMSRTITTIVLVAVIGSLVLAGVIAAVVMMSV